MTRSKRKLIFCWPYRELGGAQIYLMAIMKAARADWDVSVVLPRTSGRDIFTFLDEMDVPYEVVNAFADLDPAPSIRRKLQRQFRRILVEISIFRLLLKYNLQEGILHIETAPWQSWVLLTALACRKANVFLNLHNTPTSPSSWRGLIWRLRMQFVSRLPGFHIFTSNLDTKNHFKSSFETAFWEKIKIVYTSISPDEISRTVGSPPSRSDLRSLHSIDPNAFVVLCVGQFIDRKGRWVFLDAAKTIKNADPTILFLWLSPNSPNDADRKRIDEYGLSGTFRLVLASEVGQTREDILAFYKVANIFCLPSFVEGVPGALLEAMAIGIPSISTNVNAIPEAIDDGDTGVLIAPGDPKQLRDAILRLRTDLALRERLATAGSKFVLDKFDQRSSAAIALEAYKECFPND